MAYGLRPVNGLSGGYQSGGFTEYRMIDGETDDIFTGDFMNRETNGYVARLNGETGISPTTTNAATVTLGVTVGFRYTDPDGTPKWSQKYVGHASNVDCYAFIADDPDQLFMVQADGAGATTARADLGMNIPAIAFDSAAAVTQNTGNSAMQVDSSAAAATAALGLRLIAIVQDGANELRSGTETSNVIVKINAASHSYGTSVVVAPA